MRTLIRDLLLFLLLTFALALPVHAQQGHFQFIQVNTTSGLSNNQVNSIYKDSRGFMWFGTMSGLNRYDGIRFKTFTHDPKDSLSINDNWITRIVEGPAGKLWINTNEGYNIFDPATEKFDRDPVHVLQSLSIFVPTVQDIIRTREGNFWFIHPEQGLSLYSASSTKSRHILHSLRDSNSISSNQVASLQEDGIGNIWIVHTSGVIEQLDAKSLKVTYRNEGLARINNNLHQRYKLFIDSDNELWIYSEGKSLGVYYFQPSSGEFIAINRSGKSNQSLNSNIVMGIEQDDRRRIWIGTDHGGINLLDKSSLKISYVVNEQVDPKSLSENSINCLYKDNEDIMWVGTYKKGINYYYSSLTKFPVFKMQTIKSDWLQYGDVNAFAEDAKGNLWIGTDGGGLIYFDREKNKFRQFLNNPLDKNSISSNIIVSLKMDHNQKLWIGTYHGGLNSYDGKKFTRYIHDDKNKSSISDNSIWEIFEDSKHNLWIGTLDHGLSKYDPKTNSFIHYNSGHEHAKHSKYVSAIYEDKEGNLWLGTSAGIDVYEKATNKYVHYAYDKRNPKGLSNNTITCIYEGSRGYIWIGTYSGLNQFDPKTKTFKTFRVEDGLPENTILGILEDKNRSFWVSTTKGISNLVLNPTGSQYEYTFRNYDETDGLQGMHFNENASLLTSRGEMVFGGAAGFNIFHPEQIRINGKAPQIVLTDFEIFNNSLKPGEKFQGRIVLDKSILELKKIEIPYKANFFSIEFAALNFSQPEKNNYKYKLEGFNNEWIMADKNIRKATFTNLDPGVYTFHLKASNNDGVWNDAGIKLQITVLPPFWRTPIAYGVYGVIFLALLWAARRVLLDRERMKYNIQSKAREAEQMQELINERKKVEATREKLIAETKQSEELLRTIIDSTPDWIFIKDTGHRYILVNQAYATAMQSTPNELIGKTELELGFPDDVVRGNADKNIRGFWEDDREVIRSKETKFVTQELYELDGGPAKIMSTVKVPLLDSFGYVWGVLGFAHDITSLKKVEESLLKKDQLLQAVAEATHQLIINTSLEEAIGESIQLLGVKMHMNLVDVFKNEKDQAERILHWNSNTGYMTHEKTDIKDVPFLKSLTIAGCLKKDEIYYDLVSAIDDKYIREELFRKGIKSLAIIPIFTMHQFWGFVVFSDSETERQWSITEFSILQSFALTLAAAIERKEMEKEMMHARDVAEKANHAKSEFMANMSHELRTPMNGIIGFTDLVLTTELKKNQQDYLQNVSKSAYGLLDIINDILDFSKIEAGKLSIENIPFSLEELVEETVDILSVKTFEKKLEMLFYIEPGLPSQFYGDAVRVKQILMNLMGNAIKFTEKGEIAVSVKSESTYEVDGKKFMNLHIQVKDTGIGIPKLKLGKIFESFTQADSSTTRKYGGTGLGLTISKSLAELMGGDLSVTSELGIGSSFLLTLMLEIADSRPELQPLPKTPLRKILVIDDNETNRHLMKEIFNYFTLPCDLASDASEALAMISQSENSPEPYDLIISDHHMPGMDGITMVEELRKQLPYGRDPFILMLSSLEKNKYSNRVEKAGIHKLLSKPVKMHELYTLLLALFHQQSIPAQLKARQRHIEKITEAASILVVEDDPINMLLITEVLRKMGFDVLKAENGKVALEMLPTIDPVLILMDVNMPEMDGYETTKAIRASDQSWKNITIIALTADAMVGDKEKCFQAGMDGYVTKPFKIEEIQEILRAKMLLV